MFPLQSFSSKGKRECKKLGEYFTKMFASTSAKVTCEYVFGDYVVEITENGKLINKFIAYADEEGLIGSLRVKGQNLTAYYNRFVQEQKVLWFDADDYESDGWGEYIEFSIIHE